jgi:hypothetical protein
VRSCIVCGKTEQQQEDEQVAEGYDAEGFSSKSQGEPWCTNCWLFYNEHRQHFHPIDIVGHQPLAGGRLGIAPLHRTLPAYMEWEANWQSIGFDVDEMRRMMQANGLRIKWPPGHLPSAPRVGPSRASLPTGTVMDMGDCEECQEEGVERPAIRVEEGPHGPYLTCGQHDAPQPPPAPKPSIQASPAEPTDDVCACCGRNVPTPYHHDNKWPRTDGYDYCAACNHAGCGDPDDRCLLTKEDLKVAEHTMQITERAKLEMQLRAGIGSDGGNLGSDERADIERRLAAMDAQQTGTPVQVQTVGETFTSPPAEVAPGTPSILDMIRAQEEAEGVPEDERVPPIQPGEQHVTIAQPPHQQTWDEAVAEAAEERGEKPVAVQNPDGTMTGERLSFVEAAARVHGLPPEQVAELEALAEAQRQQAQPRPHLTGPPPTGVTMGPASPPLNPPMTAEDAVEAVMEVLQEVNDQTVVHQLFLGLLGALDPRDSNVSLAMLQWLQENGRVHKMGTLDQPLSGYIYFYNEPKGTTKEGYTPGGTQGGRMVDKAKEQIATSGVPLPGKKGMCPKCMRLVREEPDGSLVAEIDDTADCVGGGAHELT